MAASCISKKRDHLDIFLCCSSFRSECDSGGALEHLMVACFALLCRMGPNFSAVHSLTRFAVKSKPNFFFGRGVLNVDYFPHASRMALLSPLVSYDHFSFVFSSFRLHRAGQKPERGRLEKIKADQKYDVRRRLPCKHLPSKQVTF